MIAEYGGLARQMPRLRDVLPDHGALLDGPAALERLHRRVHDSPGRLRARASGGRSSPATGIVLGAAYLLWLYQRVFFGELTNPANAKLADLSLRRAARRSRRSSSLALWIGLYPQADLRRPAAPSGEHRRGRSAAQDDAPPAQQRRAAEAAPAARRPASAERRAAAVTFTRASDWFLLSPELFLTAAGLLIARDLAVFVEQGARRVPRVSLAASPSA